MVIIMDGNNIKPFCVLNILNTDRGIEIANELKEWLTKYYVVIEVHHDGKKYEYYGIKKAQEISLENKCSVLYIHTKGGVNDNEGQNIIREFWKHEFSNVEKYFNPLNTNTPSVIAPFMGEKNQTWFNGFVANYEAWRLLDIKESTDRYYYEGIFGTITGVTGIGTIMENVVGGIGKLSTEQLKMFDYVLKKKYLINDIYDKKFAVICHIYYENIFYEEIAPKLKKLPFKFDLYVTLTNNKDRTTDIKYIKELFNNVYIEVIENIGEDARGFIHSVNQMFNMNKKYDYVCKLHTKSNLKWLNELIEPILTTNTKIFESDPTFICSKKHFKTYKTMLSSNSKFLDEQLKMINCNTKTSNHFSGTIFWISFNIIKKYFYNTISESYFNEKYNHTPITKQHSFELLYGCIAYEEDIKKTLLIDNGIKKIENENNTTIIDNNKPNIAKIPLFTKNHKKLLSRNHTVKQYKRGIYW